MEEERRRGGLSKTRSVPRATTAFIVSGPAGNGGQEEKRACTMKGDGHTHALEVGVVQLVRHPVLLPGLDLLPVNLSGKKEGKVAA